MFRVTTNGMMRSYRTNLTKINGKVYDTMERVQTTRNFSSAADDRFRIGCVDDHIRFYIDNIVSDDLERHTYLIYIIVSIYFNHSAILFRMPFFCL